MQNRLSRIAIITVIVLMMAGCQQPTTPPSTDATLKSLVVNGYTMDKTFTSDTTAYAVVVAKAVETVTIVATTSDDKASVEWNKNPSTTPLVPGPNVFNVTVTAQDGTTTKIYTVTIYRANATVEVLDSVNGSLISAGGTVNVYSSGSLLYSTPLISNPQPVWFGVGSTYTVKVSPTGRAQSSKEDISGADDLKLTMICQKLDQNTFPAESPTINSVAYTSSDTPAKDTTKWIPISTGDTIDFSIIKYIKLVVSGKSEMDDTSWSGFGIMMGIDQVPSVFSGSAPDSTLSSSSYDSTKQTFTGTAIFNCSGMSITSGTHKLSFVVYDRANNRVERTLAVSNGLANTGGSDISADYFQSLQADLRIYGVSREYFKQKKGTNGLPALTSGTISYRAAITFKFQTASSGGSAVPILGFKVLRSEDDGATWNQVGAVNYGNLSTGSAGIHTFYDTDSQLTTDVEYTYKIIVFTDDTYIKESEVIGPVKFLPPFTASLKAPANKTKEVDAANLPKFEFTISDASLWDVNISDRFYFSPVIRKADGTYVYVGLLYYIFSSGKLGFYYPAGGGYYTFSAAKTAQYISFDTSTGTLSIDPSLFNAFTNYATGADLVLMSGVTYEWDVFGNYTGNASTNTAAYFQKSGINSISRSYADVYQNGQQTLNGWFSFTVK